MKASLLGGGTAARDGGFSWFSGQTRSMKTPLRILLVTRLENNTINNSEMGEWGYLAFWHFGILAFGMAHRTSKVCKCPSMRMSKYAHVQICEYPRYNQ